MLQGRPGTGCPSHMKKRILHSRSHLLAFLGDLGGKSFHSGRVGAARPRRPTGVKIQDFKRQDEEAESSIHNPQSTIHDPRSTISNPQSTISNPQSSSSRSSRNGGQSWIRTSVGVSQQIYSLPPLATRASTLSPPRLRRGRGYSSGLLRFDKAKHAAPEKFASARLPESEFPVGHDVEAHEKIRDGVHHDAGAEVLAPDAKQVGEAAVNKRSGIIDRRVGSHE